MRQLSTIHKALLGLLLVILILELVGVISFIGEPIIQHSIRAGVILMLIYQLFIAKQQEKNQSHQ
ncbi:hypothetical protein ACI2JA_01480 [Alkalihalobacillus sp. NPDC078783]